MIELKVEEYCHNCPSFEPESSSETEHLETTYDPMFIKTIAISTVVNTVVTCKYRRRCAAMFRYLKKQEGHSNEQN